VAGETKRKNKQNKTKQKTNKKKTKKERKQKNVSVFSYCAIHVKSTKCDFFALLGIQQI